MSKISKIRKAIDRFGMEALVTVGTEKINVRCFIQPMRYKNKMYIDSQYTKLGIVDESWFLYRGPAECPLTEGSDAAVTVDKNTVYNCVKTETVYLCGDPAYTWAILRLRT